MAAFEQLFSPGRGNLNKDFPKLQMPGGCPGEGMLKLRFDWYISVHICFVKLAEVSYHVYNTVGQIQLFRERLSYKWGKAYATMSKVIMGNGGFYGCLSEARDASAWWKETAQTSIYSFSFLVAESP